LVRVEMPQERYRQLMIARQSEVFVRVDANTCYVAPA
jgi:hypothetical protein